jgi:hypothetical protein
MRLLSVVILSLCLLTTAAAQGGGAQGPPHVQRPVVGKHQPHVPAPAGTKSGTGRG